MPTEQPTSTSLFDNLKEEADFNARAIPRQPVESSQIAAVGYDGATNVLVVEFRSKEPTEPNTLYAYQNVSRELYADLKTAPSVGKFFHAEIKKHPDLFPFMKVGEV